MSERLHTLDVIEDEYFAMAERKLTSSIDGDLIASARPFKPRLTAMYVHVQWAFAYMLAISRETSHA